ncbi:MAG TPA: hypothetical protein VFD72_02505 [Sphingobacteriaceae bacterium]|nr:hypothetical protein [Sphingobacteriaceae bacterium]
MAIGTGNEGTLTKIIEKGTSQLPSTVYLGAALVTMGVSACLKGMCKDKSALFVGQWAAPFLLMGIYNKIVKTEGHD